MPKLFLQDFKIGLDRRRMNETSIPGSLITCKNAHVTRGGEIEKSEAYIRFCNLPANTFGLKALDGAYVVFGSDNITPTVLNSNPPVRYQRLADPGGSESYSSFTISGMVAGDTFTSITVNGVETLPGTNTCPATPAEWAAQIATSISNFSSTSGFSAFSSGNTVTVYKTTVGTATNGQTFGHAKTGSVTFTPSGAFAGGAAATNPSMIEVNSVELFNGLPYVVAEYSDGIIRHWYNGVKVIEMESGKARATFTISAPLSAAAVQASGSFLILDPQDGCSISSILVDTVELLTATVTFDEDVDFEEGFPLKVVDAINENSNQSGFTANLLFDSKIVITAQIPGALVNGDAVSVTSSGPVNIQDEVAMAGGANAKQITSVQVGATQIMPTDVDWAESNQKTATAVASAINDNTAVSGYEAITYGSTVMVRRSVDGATANGLSFAVTADTGITILDASTTMNGGTIFSTVIEPGRFVKTFKNKMYALSGGSVYYSRLGVPEQYNGIGSGFDNLSNNAAGAEVLTAMANYFENMAIFSRNNVQVWFMSDDPDENQQIQVLNNTGTIAPDSVTAFGDNDVFYLSESGIRSLRARDTTNAAFVNDVGIAIDPLIQNELLTNNVEAERARGFLEPREGRFQLVIGDLIYVFSFFPSSKISAWSTYEPGFKISGVDKVGQTIVCRSGNALYQVGSSTRRLYDQREVKIITPFMAGEDPTIIKSWTGLDIACQGTWEIYIATDPLRVDENGVPDEAFFEKIGTITGTTYAETGGENGHCGFDAMSSHISLMMICRTPGYARIGNIAIHYPSAGENSQ